MRQVDGVEICKAIYAAVNESGFYPALTGGLLYKDGERKDCDIVIYRHRQNVSHFEMIDIAPLLASVGFSDFQFFGFVTKAKYRGLDVYLFNPETMGDEFYRQDN